MRALLSHQGSLPAQSVAQAIPRPAESISDNNVLVASKRDEQMLPPNLLHKESSSASALIAFPDLPVIPTLNMQGV
eukprot:scaffold58491_cov25-Prasinocladus_malaysianus.AAC.2